MARLNQIAKTFIWHPNPQDEKKCKILAGLAKAAIAAAFTAVGAIPGVGPQTQGGVKAAKAAKVASLSGDQASSVTNFVSFVYIIASTEDGVDRDPRWAARPSKRVFALNSLNQAQTSGQRYKGSWSTSYQTRLTTSASFLRGTSMI